MAYTPPTGTSINFNFAGVHTPSGSITFDFAAELGGPQTIYPEGWDSAAVGTAYARRSEFLLPAGIDAAAVGTASIDFRIRYLLPTGIDAAWVGEPRLIAKFVRNHDFVGAYTAPTGTAVDHDFSLGPPTLYPSGFDTAEFGTASLDIPGAVYPAGFSTTEFGTAVVIQDRFITPAGFSTTEFGTAQAYNLTQYLLPAGWVSSLVSASAAVINRNRYLRPTGEDYARVGAHEIRKPLEIEHAYYGLNSLEFGTADVALFIRTLLPDAINAAEFGATEISNYYRYVLPAGIDSQEFGATAIRRHGAAPDGFDSAQIGDHAIANFRQIIRPTGWDSLWVAANVNERPVVSNYIRYLTPTGVNSMAFGTAWVSNRIRYITPAGIAPPSISPATWVSFYTRYLTPTGWDNAAVWWDFGPLDPVSERPPGVYNETSIIMPTGFDSAEFGALSPKRAVDWTMRVSFGYRNVVQIGHDSAEFGTTRITRGTDKQVGPAAVGDTLEHGATRVAHVVSVLGAEYSALGTPSLAHRTTADAIDAAEFGTAQINQRVVATGDAFTEFGAATLAHSVAGATVGDAQFIGAPRLSHTTTPDSIDAQYIGTPQLNMNIVGAGFDSLEFGTSAIGHKLGPSGWDSLDFRAFYTDPAEGYVEAGYWVDYNHDVRHGP